MPSYSVKKTAYLLYKERFKNHKRNSRLCSLMYSRQISDKEIARLLGIKLEFWFLVKRGQTFCPEDIFLKLEEILGEEVYFIFMNQYCDKLLLPEIKRGDEY